MEDLKRDLFQIRDILDMMDFLLSEKGNQPYRVKAYMYSLKQAVNELDEHCKAYHEQYDILQLHAMSRDQLHEIADQYKIDHLNIPKQTVIYEILDKQRNKE
jgi:hypothetical protein